MSVAHGGAPTVASGGLGVGAASGREQHLLNVRERRGRRDERRGHAGKERAPHCARVCGIVGRVAESGSSLTGA